MVIAGVPTRTPPGVVADLSPTIVFLFNGCSGVLLKEFINNTKIVERLDLLSGNNTYLRWNSSFLTNNSNANGTYFYEDISSKSLFSTTPSSMDNSIVWTIFCDIIGAPCMLAFLYVLYRGIEVL